MQWLYEKLIPYFADLTGVQVVRPFQNVPQPSGRYCTLNITSIVNRDFSINLGVSLENQQTIVRVFNFTATINCYGVVNSMGSAESLVESILDGLCNDQKRFGMLGNDIAYTKVLQAPTDITGIIGNQYQPRYVLALGFEANKKIVYNENTIETVVLNGKVDDNEFTETISYNYN